MDLVTNGMEFIISISVVASAWPVAEGGLVGRKRKNDVEKENERERGARRSRAEEAKETRLLAVLFFWFWFLGFSVLVYISLTGALSRARAASRCHLHTRNKSNNKIIMARGNASYLSLAIVYRRLSPRFFQIGLLPPSPFP